jgi:hypothetical protein
MLWHMMSYLYCGFTGCLVRLLVYKYLDPLLLFVECLHPSL